MKRICFVLLALLLAGGSAFGQAQNNGLAPQQNNSQPLNLRISDGDLSSILGTFVFPATTITLVPNSTNYVYLDLAVSPPTLTQNTSGFPASRVIYQIATIVTDPVKIISVQDNRPPFNNTLATSGGGGGGGGFCPSAVSGDIQLTNGTNCVNASSINALTTFNIDANGSLNFFSNNPANPNSGVGLFSSGGDVDIEVGVGRGTGFAFCIPIGCGLGFDGAQLFALEGPNSTIQLEANSDIDIFTHTGTISFGATGTSTGKINFNGITSGGRKFGVADVAGSASDVLMPTASCTNGQVWVSNGGSPEQYSCFTIPTLPAFQTNGTPNTLQSLLNLKAGTNMTLTSDGAGGVTFAAAGGSSGACTIPSLVNGDFLTTNGSVCSWGALALAPADTPAVQGQSITAYNQSTGVFTQSSGQPCAPQFSSVDTITSSTSPTETVFATKCSIPANTIVAGTIIRATVGIDWTATATVPNFTFKVKLCTVSGCASGTVINLYTSTTTAPSAGTFSTSMPIVIQGQAAAGATATISQSISAGVGANAPAGRNAVATNVANVPTNGTLFLQFSAAFSTNAAGNSMTVTQLVFQP